MRRLEVKKEEMEWIRKSHADMHETKRYSHSGGVVKEM